MKVGNKMPKKINYQNGEQWAMIPNYSRYLISNQGRVYSVTQNKMLKLFEDRAKEERYPFVLLMRDDNKSVKIYVHMLVATAFIGDCQNKDIRHKDQNPHNNNVDNLMIISNERNN